MMNTFLLLGLIINLLVHVNGRSNIQPPVVQDGVYRQLENANITLKLYKQLQSDKTSNIFFSPVSISGALSMIQLGSKGETSIEINKLFEVAEASEKLRTKSTLGETYEVIASMSSTNVSLKTSNRVFIDENLKVFSDYLNALKVYGGSVDKFSKSTKDSVDKINKWIFDSSNQLVKDAVDEKVVTTSTRFIVASTIWFSGSWHSQFHLDHIEKRKFYITHHDYIMTEMLYQRCKFRYTYIESLALHVVELPYMDKKMSMIILLPENFHLNDLEENLTAENLDGWLSQMKYETVEIYLPKINLSQTSKIVETLKDLGIKKMFDPENNELNAIAESTKNLFVDQIIHSASIQIEQNGGEVEAERSEARKTPVDDIKIVYCDHPFLILLRSNPSPTSFITAQILAAGRISKPNGRIIYGRDEL